MDDPGKEIVVSVPHSGTRSLCTHLGLFRGDGGNGYEYLHWGQNDADINTLTGRVHIPIRHPLSVARTWDGRYPSAEGVKGGNHSIENMLWRLEQMLAFIATYHDRCLWYMEAIDLRVGKGQERPQEDTPRVIATRKWLSDKMWFYGQYYEFD